MAFQKFRMLIVVIATLLTVGRTFPISVDDDCFINLVGKGLETKSETPFLNLNGSLESVHTFTIIFQYFNISDDEEIRTDGTNLTLKESYFRYGQKLRGSCIIFLLHTLTFNETVAAIYKSGFGTSDETLFFLQLTSSIEWTDHLMKFSALHIHSAFIFHANIVFLTNDSGKIGVHCYFCPPNPTRLHFINTTSIKSYNHLKRIAQTLNAKGHGRHVLIQSAIGDLNIDKCLRSQKDLIPQTRINFYKHLRRHCKQPNIIIYFLTQQVLNATCITRKSDVPDNELDDFEWLIHLRFGEAVAQHTPNELIATRGSILILDNFEVKLLSCVTTRSISQYVDYVFVTGINWSVWLSLFIASLSYAMFHKNLSLGLDTIWHLFSLPCMLTHSRKLIFVYWICMIFLSCIYVSNISSDSVQLQEFPSFSTLIKKGYKLWLPSKQTVSRLQRKFDKEVVVRFFSSALGNDMLKGRNLEETFNKTVDLLYDGNGSRSVHLPEFENLPKLITSLTSHKLLLRDHGAAHRFGRAAVSEGLIHFENTKLCKFFDINDVSLELTLRLWSYLSYRASTVLERFTETGIPMRFEKLQLGMTRKFIRGLTVVATGSCVPPKPIKLKSAVGVSVFDFQGSNILPPIAPMILRVPEPAMLMKEIYTNRKMTISRLLLLTPKQVKPPQNKTNFFESPRPISPLFYTARGEYCM
ncbi:unnamed protein product [Orchesella dallaii]|uniref:Uncharacterized protein n=1 Tax=Orchesella dallaii TaxID=48710 RepID=A0ABP1S472_9HEXA